MRKNKYYVFYPEASLKEFVRLKVSKLLRFLKTKLGI